MPSNRGHVRVAKMMGVDDNGVSSLLDRAGRQYGPNHRKVGHTLTDAAMVLARNGKFSAENMRAAVIHIELDRAASRLPRRQRKFMVSMLEEL